MEDHYETLPDTRETHYETLPVPRVTDDHIYLDLMNNGKPKLPDRLKSTEISAVKEVQYKDKKTQSSVTTQAIGKTFCCCKQIIADDIHNITIM